MPKTHKDLLKRQVAHAYNNLDLAGEHLTNVVLEFSDVHPELVEPLTTVLAGIVIQQEVIRAWILEVWGVEEPDIKAWRNVPD